MIKNCEFKLVSALCVALLTAGVATATPVSISNADFENPVLDAGGWSDVNLDWGDDAGSSNTAFTEHIVGFASDGVNHTGVQEGQEVAQNLGVSAPANTTLTLTVAVGNRNSNFSVAGNESRFGIYAGGSAQAGGTLLAEGVIDASVFAESAFVDTTLVFNTGASPVAGDLWISLQSTGTNRAHFDNIRLDSVPPIPEPSTIVLLVMGCLGMIWMKRRRR